MQYQEIEKILDKYFDGKTSLEEEKVLRNFFQHPDVPSHLREYKILFTAIEEESQTQSHKEWSYKLSSDRWYQKNWIRSFSLAASAAILISVGLFMDNKLKKVDNEDVFIAYQQTQQAVLYASKYFSKGMEGAQSVKHVDVALNHAQALTNYNKALYELQKLDKINEHIKNISQLNTLTNYQPFNIN